jgi:hypothetical protein
VERRVVLRQTLISHCGAASGGFSGTLCFVRSSMAQE